MANRYWVGGTGNWNDVTHWAATSNGAPLGNQYIDYYTETPDTSDILYSGYQTGIGQSFTGNGSTLKYCRLDLSTSGSPTGNAVVKIYAETHATAFGTDSLPSGAALATSDNIDVVTIGGITLFTFSGANQITLTNGTKYCLAIEYSGGDAGNYVIVYADITVLTHSGNNFYGDPGSYTADPTWDMYFELLSDLAIPTSSDNVFIDSNSGLAAGTITIDNDTDAYCHDFTSNSGLTYTIDNDSYNAIYIRGSIVLESTLTLDAYALVIEPTTSESFTQNNATIKCIETYFAGTGTSSLQDTLEVNDLYIISGTFDANDKDIVSSNVFIADFVSVDFTVNMGSGTWEITDSFFAVVETTKTITLNCETSTIKFTDSSTIEKTFYGSYKTYYNLWITGSGTGRYMITGSNTFNEVKVDTPPHTIMFEGGETQTIGTWTVNGSAGNLVTITSTPDEVDSNDTSDSGYTVDNTTTKVGQTFTGISGTLNSVIFALYSTAGTPTGNCYAKIYEITGTFGSTSIPEGNPIATSDALTITSVDSFNDYVFTFSGSNKITLSANTNYAVVFEWADGTVADYVSLDVDTTAPTHSGNLVYYSGAVWNADAAKDLEFTVYVDSSTPATLAYAGTGTVACDYLDVKNITGYPRHTWAVGSHSTDSGNNTYLYFIDAFHIDSFVTKGNSTFEVGDVLRIKDGTDDEWMVVSAVTDSSHYTVIRDMLGSYSVGSFPTWKKGASIVNYRQPGDGGVYMTASETNAPYLSVFTHDGSPWDTITTRLRIGNLNGYLGYSTDAYGIAIGETNKYLKYDPTNGLRIGGGTISLDNTGYIACGKTTFDNTSAGFIMGTDPADSVVKLLIGNSTEYFNIIGDTLINTLRVPGYAAGTVQLIASDAEKSKAVTTVPTIMKQIKLGRDGTYRVTFDCRSVNNDSGSQRSGRFRITKYPYWNFYGYEYEVTQTVAASSDSGWVSNPLTGNLDITVTAGQSLYLYAYCDGSVTAYVRNFKVKVNALNEIYPPEVIVA